jgi:hypothetical protein
VSIQRSGNQSGASAAHQFVSGKALIGRSFSDLYRAMVPAIGIGVGVGLLVTLMLRIGNP